MSYRAFKHLLGETSLERKCRWLLGTGVLVLMSASFYVYADYTQPPTIEKKLSPNLCATIAPIRYCRLHAMGDPICPSRKQQVEMVDGWAKVASRLLSSTKTISYERPSSAAAISRARAAAAPSSFMTGTTTLNSILSGKVPLLKPAGRRLS